MHNRKHKRVVGKALARTVRAGEKFAGGLVVGNLSLGGAFIRTADPMPLASAVVIDLARAGLRKGIRLTGRVIKIVTREEATAQKRFPGMGIQFDPLDAELETRLLDLLTMMAPPGEDLRRGDVAKAEPPSDAVEDHGQNVLKVQVTGLIMELGDLHARIKELERENEDLRAELSKLKRS